MRVAELRQLVMHLAALPAHQQHAVLRAVPHALESQALPPGAAAAPAGPLARGCGLPTSADVAPVALSGVVHFCELGDGIVSARTFAAKLESLVLHFLQPGRSVLRFRSWRRH